MQQVVTTNTSTIDVRDHIIDVEPPILNREVYGFPLTSYIRREKAIEGRSLITLSNTSTTTEELIQPGNIVTNLNLLGLSYDVVVPATGDDHLMYGLPADKIVEIKAISATLVDTGQELVNILDLPKYTKQHCATKLDFTKRSKMDRIYFNSERTTPAIGQNPALADQFYQLPVNNGINAGSFNVHSNLILSGNEADVAGQPADSRVHKFEYRLCDILPHTYFELDLAMKYTSPLSVKLQFNFPNKMFVSKVDNANGLFTTVDAMPDIRIRNLRLVYYTLRTDELDSENVIRKLSSDVFSFYYPKPLISSQPLTGSGEVPLVSKVSSNQGVTIFKKYATLFKNDSPGHVNIEADPSNFFKNHMKWSKVIFQDGDQVFEVSPLNMSYQKLIENYLGKKHSFTNLRSYENYGTVMYVYETSFDPNEEYNSMTLRGKLIGMGTQESTFTFFVIDTADNNGDTDNPNNRYIQYITTVVFKKGIYTKGVITL